MESGIFEHTECIATDWRDFSWEEPASIIELEFVWRVGRCSEISDCLPVVFFSIIEVVQLKESVGGGLELDIAEFILDILVLDCERSVFDQPWIAESALPRQ